MPTTNNRRKVTKTSLSCTTFLIILQVLEFPLYFSSAYINPVSWTQLGPIWNGIEVGIQISSCLLILGGFFNYLLVLLNLTPDTKRVCLCICLGEVCMWQRSSRMVNNFNCFVWMVINRVVFNSYVLRKSMHPFYKLCIYSQWQKVKYKSRLFAFVEHKLLT